MKNTIVFRHTLLVLSVSLLTCFSPSIAEEANNKPDDTKTEKETLESTQEDSKFNDSNTYDNGMQPEFPAEYQRPAENTNENATILNNKKRSYWDNSNILIGGGSALISLLAMLISGIALWRVKIKNTSAKALKQEFERDRDSLKSMISLLENKVLQEQIKNKEQFNEIREFIQTSKKAPITLTTPEPIRHKETSYPSITPNTPPRPLGPSKSSLIAALNNGDRKQVREATLSELNITSESENAFITGRSANTELEEVIGGGSYLLLMLQGQPWLFPTEKTLKSFTTVQNSMGMFESEQQTIANCQLLEPALLERSGNRWTIKKIGRIATP